MKKALPVCLILLFAFVLAPLTSNATYYSGDGRGARAECSPEPQAGACVHCALRGDCRSCQGAGASANCNTPDCENCWEDNACGSGIGGILNTKRESGSQSISDSDAPLRIAQGLIRQIAAVHPRFGATLANLNLFGFYSGVQRVYWTPVDIIGEDIEAFLSRREHREYFAKLNNRGRRLNRQIQEGAVTEIVYDVVVGSSESNPRTIELHVHGTVADVPSLSVDPPYTSLEIKLLYQQGSKRLAGEKPVETTWQIK